LWIGRPMGDDSARFMFSCCCGSGSGINLRRQ
jgi:hypothetical protein